jgi:hypothetical protein
MGIEVLIPLLAIFSIFFIPITGLMIILTSRYALKPLAETLAKALRESGYAAGGSPEEIRALSEQIEVLTEEVRMLKTVSEFDRQLLASRTTEED